MSEASLSTRRRELEPLPENIRSAQPGGGVCYSIELGWGRWRRWLLRRLRPRYVERMAQRRQGTLEGCPHEIIDSRDLKFCRNVCDVRWDLAEDRFAWRKQLPFAYWGQAELLIMGLPLLAATLVLGWYFWPGGLLSGVLLALVLYFFRDPRRRTPAGEGLLISPADGTIAEVTHLDHDEFIDGPAVRIGIFLSIFNVHINRAPCRARVLRLQYNPGEFMNALRPESTVRNENMWIALEEEPFPHRPLTVRQISGALARRIVCDLKPGQVLEAGEKFGMIKLGSRTELIVPDEPGLAIEAQIGQAVRGGETVLARYSSSSEGTRP